MTLRTPIAIQAISTPTAAEEFRGLLGALLLPFGSSAVGGIVKATDLVVAAQGAPNMSVQVAAGRIIIPGTTSATQGPYSCFNDASLNVTIGAADPTNPRNDLIVAQIEDPNYAGINADWTITAVPGTPAGAPVDPAIPASSMRLARVRVNAAATSIVTGNITDLRQRLTMPYRCRAYLNPGLNSQPVSPFKIPLNVISYDPHLDFSLGNSWYVIPVAGSYLIAGRVSEIATAGGALDTTSTVRVNGNVLFRLGEGAAGSVNQSSNTGADVWPLNAGDQISLWTEYSSISPINIVGGQVDTFLSVHFLALA